MGRASASSGAAWVRRARHVVGRPATGRMAASSRPCRLGVTLIALALSLLGATGTAWAEEGVASWYGEEHHGRRMANGQPFDMYDPTTAASRVIPMGTWLRVTSLSSGRSIEVQIRDRGGLHALDLSYAAFAALAAPSAGLIRVRYEVIPGPGRPPAPPAPPPAAPPPARAPAASPPAAARPTQAYVVQEGDTLSEIAERFGVETQALAQANSLGADAIIRVGQELRVWTAEWHVVAPGDTLSSIAERYATTVDVLVRLNSLADPDHITLDQRLRLR